MSAVLVGSGRRSRSGLKYLVGLAIILAAVAYIVYGSLGSNLVFFITPSEYLRDEARYAGRTVRLGGVVERGTVKFDRASLELRFTISDGTARFPVVHSGTPPDLFQEGMGVTVEGKFAAATGSRGAVFQGETLLVKHSEEYRAPRPGEKVNYRKIIEDAR